MQSSVVADFNRLSSAFTADISATFEGTREKPLSFPGTSANLPQIQPETTEITAVLRSIRAPRFEVSYTVPSTSTVFSLKERLLSDPNSPLGPDHSLASIKLLLKAKALSDVRVIGDLPAAEFTVMLSNATGDSFVPTQVYWPETAPETPKAAPEAAPGAVPEAAPGAPEASPKAPEAAPKADNLIKDITKVLEAHNRLDLLEKITKLI